MTTVESDNARRECEWHVEKLEEFDRWVYLFGFVGRGALETYAYDENAGVDDDTREEARRALDWLDVYETDELSWSPFVNGALDVEVNGRLVSTGWEVTDVALLVSFGGPTVRMVTDDADTIRVEVSWWGDRASAVLACGLAGELWEIGFERSQAVAR